MGASVPVSSIQAGMMCDHHQQTDRATLPRWARRLISAWLVFHLMAIVVAPLSVSPSSALFQRTWLVFRPYLQALYLNHGYHFFAPEPGESTLLAYTVERANGEQIVGHIPRRDLRPRLLYHRHFMLTEQMPFVPPLPDGPPGLPPGVPAVSDPPELIQDWYRSYARCLLRKYNGSRVTLERVVHYLPSAQMVLDGATLDDPASFQVQPLGTYRRDEL